MILEALMQQAVAAGVVAVLANGSYTRDGCKVYLEQKPGKEVDNHKRRKP